MHLPSNIVDLFRIEKLGAIPQDRTAAHIRHLKIPAGYLDQQYQFSAEQNMATGIVGENISDFHANVPLNNLKMFKNDNKAFVRDLYI
jgi:hypothetical protein